MKKIKTPKVPVTRGIKDIYGMDMHIAFQAAATGHFTLTHFSRLAVALSNVRTALAYKPVQIENASDVLDVALLTLLGVRQRGDITDIWEILPEERANVLAGIQMAESCLGRLDVTLLDRVAQQLLREMTS